MSFEQHGIKCEGREGVRMLRMRYEGQSLGGGERRSTSSEINPGNSFNSEFRLLDVKTAFPKSMDYNVS